MDDSLMLLGAARLQRITMVPLLHTVSLLSEGVAGHVKNFKHGLYVDMCLPPVNMRVWTDVNDQDLWQPFCP